MNTETTASLTANYLAQLEQEARRLPADQAADLVADIRDHLSTAVSETDTEAHTREILDRLGTPRAVVDGALADAGEAPTAPIPPAPPTAPPGGVGPYVDRLGGAVQNARQPGVWGGFETAALICLLGAEIGFILLPIAGVAWIAGLVFLGISRVWTSKEKVLGYLLIGSGFPLAALTLLAGIVALPFAVVSSVTCSGTAVAGTTDGFPNLADPTSTPSCTTSTSGSDTALYVVIALAIVFLAAQIFAVVKLLQARRRKPAAA